MKYKVKTTWRREAQECHLCGDQYTLGGTVYLLETYPVCSRCATMAWPTLRKKLEVRSAQLLGDAERIEEDNPGPMTQFVRLVVDVKRLKSRMLADYVKRGIEPVRLREVEKLREMDIGTPVMEVY